MTAKLNVCCVGNVTATVGVRGRILYLNGVEFARVERREDLPAVLGIEGPRSLARFPARMRALFGGEE